MSDYIMRSDALRFALFCIRNIFDSNVSLDDKFKEIPSADVVEVVRCKDCFYGRIYGNSNSYYCVLTTACHGDDFFCANGARMDGGT